jgi:predicted MFS family arabinose efflux permease
MSASGRIFYGWIVVAVTVPVLMVLAGLGASRGAWLVPMREDLGWSTATLSIAAAIGLVVYGLAGPIAGTLIQRFGVRPVTVASILLSALSMFLTSYVQTKWQLFLVFGFATGLAAGLVGMVLGAVVANRWFVRHRGLVVGIMGASVSAGQLVFFPLLTVWGVELGWRTAALLLAGICLLLVVPVLAFLRGDPERIGLAPLGGVRAPVAAPERAATVMHGALRSPTFWLLCLTFYICGATSTGIVGQHCIPHAMEHGFSAYAAAGALALVGVFNFVGTIASGWLTDRYDPRRLLLIYYVFRGISLVALPFVHEEIGLIAFAVLFGLDYIATVPPTVALAADIFGRRNVGVVYGWIFAAHQLGAALAAWGAGVAPDAVGDYVVAFYAAGVLANLAGGMALLIKRTPAPPATPTTHALSR